MPIIPGRLVKANLIRSRLIPVGLAGVDFSLAGDDTILLPQNLLTSPGTLYEDFETAADWTLYGTGATKVDDIVNYKTGTHSLGVITAVNGLGRLIRDWGSTRDLSGVRRISLWIYIDNADPVTTPLQYFLLDFSSVSNFAKHKTSALGPGYFIHGWQHFEIPLADFADTGTEDWTIIRYVRWTVQARNGAALTVSSDTLEYGHAALPAVVLYFDDGYNSTYTKCFAKMKLYKIPGTLAVITDVVGTGGYCSWSRLQELNAAGWSIVNHTDNHTDLATLTEANQELRISGGKTALDANGLSRCSKYLVYPNGSWNTNTMIAVTNLGVPCARDADNVVIMAETLPPFSIFHLNGLSVLASTVATVEGWIDNAISKQTIAPLLFHDIGGGGQMSEANFGLVIDYLYTKIKAGLIYPLTIDDLYNLTLGPVRVPRIR